MGCKVQHAAAGWSPAPGTKPARPRGTPALSQGCGHSHTEGLLSNLSPCPQERDNSFFHSCQEAEGIAAHERFSSKVLLLGVFLLLLENTLSLTLSNGGKKNQGCNGYI